jgi:hypothetical protein
MKIILAKLDKINLIKLSKIIIFILLITFFGLFLVSKIALPGALDLPRQIQNGEDILKGDFDVLTKNVYSYIEPDQPFANHHWFFGVFSYVLFEIVGWGGLSLFKVLFMLSTFAFLFWLVLKRSNFWLVSLFSIPAIFIMIGRTAFRPEIFSYFFVVLFLYLLFNFEKNPKSNKIFWLIPLELVWVNMHMFFPIGILLVLGFLFEKIVLNYKKYLSNGVIKKLILLLCGLIVTIFLNPCGIKGVLFSLAVNTASDFPIHSMEVSTIFNALMVDPSASNISIQVFLPAFILLMMSFVGVFILRWKKKLPLFTNNFIFLLLASIGSAGLSYFIFRGLPLFGAIFLLAICTNLKEIYDVFKLWLNKKVSVKLLKIIKSSFAILIIALIIFSISWGYRMIMQYQDRGFGLTKDSLSSVEFFKGQGLKGPIFNDTDSGSYLIGELYPEEKVFADNRFGDAYSSSFFSDIYIPMIQNEDKWEEGLAKYHFNTIFMYHYNQGESVRDFIFRRVYDSDWVLVHLDKYNIIFVRNDASNKDIIDKYKITTENIYDRLRYLVDSGNPIDKRYAADMLNLLGLSSVSTPVYLQYLSLKPGAGEIWFVLGRTELLKADQNNSNPSLAAMYLENALKNDWKTWKTYSFLALAYYRTGQMERVKEMVKKEIKIIGEDNQDIENWRNAISEKEKESKIHNE